MKRVLKITSKISELQYVGKNTAGKKFKMESTVPVREGQTVLATNNRITGVIRAETMTTYNV